MYEAANNNPLVDVRHYFNSCLKQWKLVTALFLAVFIPMAFFSLTKPVLYTASAKVLVDNDRRVNIELSTTLSVRDAARIIPLEKLNSQTEVIESSALILELIRTLGLAQTPEQEQVMLQKLQSRIRAQVIPTSAVIVISYTDEDPDFARTVVNTLVDIYFNYHMTALQGDDAVAFYQEQFQFADNSLKENMGKLNELHERIGINASYEVEHKNLVNELSSLKAKLNEIDLSISQNKAKSSILKKQLSEEPNRINSTVVVIPNPASAALTEKLSALTSEKDAMLVKYTQEHPEVKRLTREIQSLTARVRQVPTVIEGKNEFILNPRYQSLERDFAQTQAEIGQLINARQLTTSDISEVESKLNQIQQVSFDLVSYEDAITSSSKARRLYYDKLVDARFIDTLSRHKITGIKVIEKAEELTATSKHRETLALSFALSCLIAFATVFLRDRHQPRLYSAGEVREVLKVPVLAALPDYSKTHAIFLNKNNNNIESQST